METVFTQQIEQKDITQQFGTANIERRIMLKTSATIAKIEAALIQGAVSYCESTSYQLILIPHLTRATGACENFSTLFSTDLFGQTSYLNQTGQLMLEAFMDRFNKTYCYGPSFRKETKADERHLIEFPLFEIEVADMNLKGLQKEVSNIIAAMIKKVKQTCAAELKQVIGTTEHLNLLMPPYNIITYRQAIAALKEYNLKFGDDLKAEHEQELVKQNGGKPLFVTHYPEKIKFFNMRLNRKDSSVVNSMDLLMPFSGEAVGAAEREENYQILEERLKNSDMVRLLIDAIRKEPAHAEKITESSIRKEALQRFVWYMNIIKQHPIRHAGCGIGISRVTQAILQINDIRFATAFPLNRETLF